MNNVLLSFLVTETNQCPPVGGPLKIALITIPFLTVRGQGDFFAVPSVTEPDIVVFDEGLDLLRFFLLPLVLPFPGLLS